MEEILHSAEDVKRIQKQFGCCVATVKYALKGTRHSILTAKIRNYAVAVLGCRVREGKPVRYL